MGMERKYAVIVACGAGLRAGGEVPKQFQMLEGLPVVWWSIKAFYDEDPDVKIIVVLHPGFFDLWDILYSELPCEIQKIDVELVCGGRSRLESVKNGISRVDTKDNDALIAVHDAARPLITAEMITRGWRMAAEKGCAVPVMPMSDSLRELTADGSVAVDRSRYVRVQTPQIFKVRELQEAYGQALTDRMTDDASVMENAGHSIYLYEGEEANFKITKPVDFILASALLKERMRK